MRETSIPDRFPARLKLGQGVIGRDYPGCCNAGAPVLLHSRLALRYLGKAFAVGPIFEVRFNLAENVSKAMAGGKPNCKFFATYRAAKAEFARLEEPIDKAYQEIAEAKRKLTSPDFNTKIEAAMTLSDNGMI